MNDEALFAGLVVDVMQNLFGIGKPDPKDYWKHLAGKPYRLDGTCMMYLFIALESRLKTEIRIPVGCRESFTSIGRIARFLVKYYPEKSVLCQQSCIFMPDAPIEGQQALG